MFGIIGKMKTLVASIMMIATVSAMEQQKTALTTISKRCDVMESYYGEDHNNPDPTIFEHLYQWHNQDFEIIEKHIQTPENRKKLYAYKQILEESTLEGIVGFHKFARTYFLYSLILSKEIDPNSSDDQEDADQSIAFIQSGQVSDSSDLSDLRGFLPLLGAGYRCLPFVSQTGHAGYRILNRFFGMGCPILGLPLKRSNYDGNIKHLPDLFYTHDVNHVNFEAITECDLPRVYSLYRKLNQIIAGIEDSKTQFLCDLFLYEIGHEGSFAASLNNGEEQSYQESDLINLYSMKNLFLTMNTFNEFCDRSIQDLKNGINKLSDPEDTNFYLNSFPYLLPKEMCKEIGKNRKNYFENDSNFRHLLNPETGQLYSVEEMIIRFNIDKNSYLTFDVITSALGIDMTGNEDFCRNYWEYPFADVTSDTLPMVAKMIVDYDFIQYCNSFQGYNELIDSQNYFQKQGLDFVVWNGDIINVDGLGRFYDLIGETFRNVVGAKFLEV